jgi:hypothetical protein
MIFGKFTHFTFHIETSKYYFGKRENETWAITKRKKDALVANAITISLQLSHVPVQHDRLV